MSPRPVTAPLAPRAAPPRAGAVLQPGGRDHFVLIRPDGAWHLFEEPYDPALRRDYDRHSLALRPLSPILERPPQVSLIVFVSEACNLRCDYCKVSAMITAPDKKRTDPAAISAAIVAAAESTEGQVDVIFYGGEPMLEHQAIDRICTAVKGMLPEHRVYYSMTTNGTLLNEQMLATLIRHRISVGVSIDGDPDYHDAHRGNLAGRGTHRRAIANYARMKRSGVECGPICVVSDPSRLIESFDYFVEGFGDRFIYLKPLEVHGAEDAARLRDYFDAYAEAQLTLLARCVKGLQSGGRRLVETRTSSILKGVLRSHDPAVRSCRTSGASGCSIGQEILGVEADGEVIPCPNVKKHSRTDPAFIEAIERRGGYCDGCAYQPVCPSFCLAEMDEPFIEGFIAGGDTAPIDAICAYNRQVVDGIFALFRADPGALMRYARDS